MPHWGTIARWALGLMLISCGGFAYLDEERKLKNRLCDLWFRVTLASERATAGVVAGTGFVLRTLEKVMAWLYGPRVISLQGAWTGLMTSLAAFPILAGVFFLLAAPNAYRKFAAQRGVASVVFAILIALAILTTWGLFVAAKLPSRFRRFRFTVAGVSDLGPRLLISAVIIVGYLTMVRALAGQGRFVHPWAGVGLMLVFGTLENMISMSILRWAGRRWEKSRRQQGWGRVASAGVVFAACCGAFFTLIRAPALIVLLHGARDFWSQALVLSILTNALEVIFVLGLLAVVGFFLLHAAAWEGLLRLIEKLHVELPRKTIVTVGFLVLTGRPIWEGVKKVLDIPGAEAVQGAPTQDAGDHGARQRD